ncbi:hypothetical protein [Pelagibius sp.]|uniref:extracellular catalytic domain type 2 short-chain-length polyhydroxyalkanoate depolymerase n=1 Tax=Pelagibius sp. TaxID=1931238 RepID=UPI003B5039EF
MSILFLRFAIAFNLCVAAMPATAKAADPLPALRLDPAGTTVSGLSSGAYMAVQLHVAHSKSIIGAAVVAGGPYFCAEGQLMTALNRCMQTTSELPDVAALLAQAQSLADAGRIDPLANLAGDRIYLFSGTEDNTVTPPVMAAARDFYRQAGIVDQDIETVTDVAAGHAFIAEGAPVPCAETETPFLNDCGFDQAGDILQHLYGALLPPQPADAGRLIVFDQTEFLADPESHGMATGGFAYVPAACATGEDCRLHIAFAGCRQTPEHIGDLYARTAGFNRWAESNRLVVLYPQSSTSPGNPNGCWDWWGYDDSAYHTKSGRQIKTVAAMAARLGVAFVDPAPAFCETHDAWNWSHWFEGRAEVCGWGSLCAVGSGDPVGFFYGSATLYESPEGSFSMTSCSP